MAYVVGLNTMKKLAKQGNAGAQNYVGMAYDLGSGVEQDCAEAEKWYRLAAEQGHVDAQLRLGKIYAQGVGVEKDVGEAVKWYRKAAEQGATEAQAILRHLSDTNEGSAEAR